jgi:drug/metabolite transporter, DME family
MHTPHVLALVAAFVSAWATIFVRRGMRASDPYAALWINVLVGTVVLWIAVPFTGDLGRASLSGFALFAAAGVIGTVAGRLLRFVAIDRVGASIAAALTNLNPLFAALLAIVMLGERVTWPIALGTLVIVCGTVLLSFAPQKIGFRRRHLIVPVLSALCFGVVAVLRKLGLGQMGPVAGAAVNVTTALVAYGAFLLASGQRASMLVARPSVGYLLAAGLAENAAVFMNLLALRAGMVSVVTPLYGTTPIFVLALSAIFLRDVETVTGKLVLGTVLIVVGIYLITALSGARP